jgi:hypothetical protein
MKRLAGDYKFPLEVVPSMKDVPALLESPEKGRTCILLVKDVVFDADVFGLLADSCGYTLSLLTFGKEGSVRQSQGHYRSLSKIIPAALVDSMVSHLQSSVIGKEKARPSRASCHNDIKFGEYSVL